MKKLILLLFLCTSSLFAERTSGVVKSDAGAGQDKPDGESCAIVVPDSAPGNIQLAAKEIRRYVYLRTGELLPLRPDGAVGKEQISLAVDPSLGEQEYRLKSSGVSLQISGGSEVAVLYGAYHFIEKMGVRFYIHGDTIPDEKIAFSIPKLDETHKPLFALRGVLPFHNFPVGPTLWDSDNYMAVIAQMAKMRMNFIGFHSYTKALPYRKDPEPFLWWGLKEDINPDGTVRSSSGSSFSEFTLSGMKDMGTEHYSFGAADLFPRKLYGSDLFQDFMPVPKTDEERNAVYNRTGKFLDKTFGFANKLGVKTCIGGELNMPLPDTLVKKLETQGKDPADPAVLQEVYEGVFERIKRTHPLDYFWLWTTEGWTWNRIEKKTVDATVAEMKAAMRALDASDATFALGTSGWVLGPREEPTMFDKILGEDMFVSCINRNLGASPVDALFGTIQGRPKWAMPWLENDYSMNIPQLWVGQIRKDAVDAKAYGCTGLIGIHWRTRIIGPNISAMAKAGWDQNYSGKGSGSSPIEKHPVKVSGGRVARFDSKIQGAGIQEVFQTIRYGDMSYHIALPNKKYKVTFQMLEPEHNESKRIFSIELNGKRVLENINVYAEVGMNRAYEKTVENIQVVDGSLNISFVSHQNFACIAGIVIEEHAEKLGPDDQPVLMQINCGGDEGRGYISDIEKEKKTSRFLATDDFYLDWSEYQFGLECARQIADVFIGIDGRLPKVSAWGPGPGGIRSRPYNEAQFAFVDELAALEKKIQGKGNRERFDYWLNEFRYMRSMSKVAGLHHSLKAVLNRINKEKDVEEKKRIAREKALPLRNELVKEWGEMFTIKLSHITTTGGIGDIINLEEENRFEQRMLDFADKPLATLLGEALPPIPQDYRGPARLFVPAVRTILEQGEDLNLKIMLLAGNHPHHVTLFWRPLGKGQWKKANAKHESGAVYRVQLPGLGEDIEYYIEAETAGKEKLVWPATAPELMQSVVVTP